MKKNFIFKNSSPELDELYATLEALKREILKRTIERSPMRARSKTWRPSLTHVLFQALSKTYLLGIAVGIRGERKRRALKLS